MSSTAWNTWTSNATTTGTSTRAVWNMWVSYTTDTTTSSTTLSATDTWGLWIRESTNTVQTVSIASDRQQKLEREKNAAENKAKKLLEDLIGADQLEIYNKTGRLFVKGREYDYLLQKEGHVKRIEKDKIQDLCIHLENKHKYPATDNIVALKLFLEADEKAFNEMANKHGVYDLPERLPEAACMGL